MQLRAPAKINLSLRILGKREDGFHEIETVIAPVSFADELTVEKRSNGIEFCCDDPSLSNGRENLVVRAAETFFTTAKLKNGVSIQLKKKIPHGAGLGGGSSDAASTLLGLNELFGAKLPREALARAAASIGSDVPFFIFQSAAVCKGRGELVAPISLPRPLPLLLLKPEFGVSTPWAYARWQNSRQLPETHHQPQHLAGQTFINDLERPVFEKFVFLAQLKTWLLAQPEVGAALMSGSGSTMFAVMRSNADADLLANRAKAELDPQLWTCACETTSSSE